MSGDPESCYVLNVARMETGRLGGPTYWHFCRVELATYSEGVEQVQARARDIVARFPSPEFKCTLDFYDCRAVQIPLT